MKKTVQIVTIPLDKQSNFGIFKDVEDGEIIFMDTSIKDNPYWQAQQLLVLSDDKLKKGDVILSNGNVCDLLHNGETPQDEDDPIKIIASYPQLSTTLPISKKTVEEWIDAGTPGEGSVEIGDTIYCSVVKGKVKYGDPTKLDHQGNLLLEFSKEITRSMQGYNYGDFEDETKPSIPTDEEIEEKFKELYKDNRMDFKGLNTPLHPLFTAFLNYQYGYKQALKDLGYE